jgi:hypothetical protein
MQPDTHYNPAIEKGCGIVRRVYPFLIRGVFGQTILLFVHSLESAGFYRLRIIDCRSYERRRQETSLEKIERIII